MVKQMVVSVCMALAVRGAFAAVPIPKAEFLPAADVRVKAGPSRDAAAAARKKLFAVRPEELVFPFRRAAALPAKCNPSAGREGKSRETEGRELGFNLSAMSALCVDGKDDAARDRVDYVVEELFGCVCASKSRRKRYFMTVPEAEAFKGECPAFPARTACHVLEGLIDANRLAGNERAFWLVREWVDWFRDEWWKKSDDAKARDARRAKWLEGDWAGLNRAFMDVYKSFGVVHYFHDGWNIFCMTPYFDAMRKGEYNFAAESAEVMSAKMEGVYMRHLASGWDELRKATFAYLDYARKTPKYGADSDEATFDLMSLAARAFEEEPSAQLMDFIDAKVAVLSKRSGASQRIGPADVHAVHPARYAYSTSPQTVWINQYLPSVAVFREKRLGLVADPGGTSGAAVTYTLLTKGRSMRQCFRFRSLKGARPRVSVNGTPVQAKACTDGYVEVVRDWSDGDTISVYTR